MPTLTIPEAHSGSRLDVALAKLVGAPRAKIQRLIKSKTITLNRASTSSHVKVKALDEIFYPELLMDSPRPKKGAAPLLDILYQDEDVLVINKPAGLLVHEAGPADGEPTVVDALLERYPTIAQVGEDPSRPGIVHRLDREVSGAMVIAKTPLAFKHLKAQFLARTIQKEYLALAYGRIQKDLDTITLKIARSRERGRMVARAQGQDGKEATTEFTVLARYKTVTFVRVITKTGRTHQIRAHFKAIDHPLVGDKLYKKKHMKNIHPIPLDRIFLHAAKLAFTLPDGKQKLFEVPLPDDLKALLKTLPTV